MAVSFNLKCDQCDYIVESVMTTTIGHFGALSAYVCTHCNELVDVLTETREGNSKESEARLWKCPHCHLSDGLVMWDAKKTPCPKCNGKMINHGFSFWD